MRKISTIFLLFISCSAFAQREYITPWWGALGFHTNSTTYSSEGAEIKAPLTFIDLRAVYIKDKFYAEWGLPITTYLLTGVIFGGELPNDVGEVSAIYGKLGWTVFDADMFKLGLGASFDARGIDVSGIVGYGASLQSYGTLSPLVYAKVDIGPFLLLPTFEYNLVSFANTSGTKRPGFTLGAQFIVPLGESIGINISPILEKGKYKSDTTPDMTSTNVAFKIGIVKSL